MRAKNNSQSTEKQADVRKINGAGYVLGLNDAKYILAFGYFSESDANKVKENMSKSFSEALVLTQNFPKIKNRVKRYISSISDYKDYFKFLSQIENEIYNLATAFDQSTIDIREIYKYLVKNCLQIEEMMNNVNNINCDNLYKNNIKKQFITSLSYIKDSFESCKTEIYKGENVSVYTKFLFIDICENEISLRKELNKI
ncbi:MAG: hypothetical protein IJS74_00615 [Clostridia bacterium]|nr:hypothetical protein [Clostridia bacterium]